MIKKLIAFDLDGTLAPSKSHFDPKMVDLFNKLLEKFEVCVISGAKYELFQTQFLTQITKNSDLLAKLHLLPTTGTRYYKFHNQKWQMIYAEDFTPEEKKKIIETLKNGWEVAGESIEKTYGATIEDRDSQITLSPLGQEVVAQLGDEGVTLKEAWDPDMKKRLKVAEVVKKQLPDFNVKVAGLTSIDVTIPGVDKAYGMQKLMEATGFTKEQILFIGDKLDEGGNDYPVKAFGIDTIAVQGWQDTAGIIENLLKN